MCAVPIMRESTDKPGWFFYSRSARFCFRVVLPNKAQIMFARFSSACFLVYSP